MSLSFQLPAWRVVVAAASAARVTTLCRFVVVGDGCVGCHHLNLLSLLAQPADVPQDEKYHLYKIGRATIITPLYLHYSARAFRAYMTTLGIIPEERDIWLSIKFQGPTFVPGSSRENAILVDRGFYVK